jgi:ubiquinone/menaquinone biosynthesis C-methylase UbiE
MNVAYLACGGWIAAAVGAAADLCLADLLVAGPLTLEELAKRSGARPHVLAPLLRLLVLVGVFRETEYGRYTNTEDGNELLSSSPHSKRSFCMLAAGTYQRAFLELRHALTTGEPAAWHAFGGSLYRHLERDSDAAEIYDQAMAELTRGVGPALAAARSFADDRTVVDVGGGRGTLLRGLLAAFPHLQGICVDRVDVCDRATRELTSATPELASRLRFVAGDFFGSLPAGAEAYVLKNVLHNWSDESAAKILAAVRRVLRPSSRLLVIESLAGGAMPKEYQCLDELMQVVICEPGTTARNEQTLVALLASAELTVLRVLPLASGHTLLEASAGGV